MTDRAVILAGGRGRRLAPYTTILPKPLMPLFEDKSIIEHVLKGIAASGIEDVTITLGYLGHLIEAVVGDGARLGMQVSYTREETPLGTAGPLSLLRHLSPTDRILVVNGDTFTDINYLNVLTPLRGETEAVVACVQRSVETNYGVVYFDEMGTMTEYKEKPKIDMVVSTGIYGLLGSALNLVTPGARLDMPELLTGLMANGRKVHCFLSDCEWKDLGRPEDFASLQRSNSNSD